MPRRLRNLMPVCVLPDPGWVIKAVQARIFDFAVVP